ncbi:MAG: extracellular solute-binding protein, partial [Planctomycetes bacterium]|nr:extracellular solute-binding protein [Planctomycetota bacterium]
MSRIRVSRLSVCAFAVALLAMAASSLGAATPKARQKIVFWNLFTTGASHEVITELVQRFNAASRDYYVEKTDIPYTQLHTKMLPAIAGNVPPDVSTFDRFLVASYAARGAFMELDELARRDGVRREDFFEPPWDECLYEGRQYAAPYDTDVRVLYYNKALFRAAGLDPERPPRTWSELREVSRALTKRRSDGHLAQTGYLPIYGNTSLYLYGWQKGGRFVSPDGRRVTLNDPKIVAALEWLSDFCKEYGIENLLTFQSGFGADAQNPFITGKIAMVVWDVGAVNIIQRYGADLD